MSLEYLIIGNYLSFSSLFVIKTSAVEKSYTHFKFLTLNTII